jgi:hypothetical protein
MRYDRVVGVDQPAGDGQVDVGQVNPGAVPEPDALGTDPTRARPAVGGCGRRRSR